MVLPTAVTTDYSGSGLCGSAPGATIPPGTAVEVYMLHHDPVDSNPTRLTLDLDTSTHLDQVRVLVEANACY